jgi:hypothetical protein
MTDEIEERFIRLWQEVNAIQEHSPLQIQKHYGTFQMALLAMDKIEQRMENYFMQTGHYATDTH